MICVATNSTSSYDHIDSWRNKIQQVEQEKPIMIVLTKTDLSESVSEKVEYPQIQEKVK